MYVIRFTKDTRIRYATETRGDPEYNAIDTVLVQGAKTWQTKRGADNYLKSKVLTGRAGRRIQARWTHIEVVEIGFQERQKDVKIKHKSPAILTLLPTPEILSWLESQRQAEETDSELLNRKLRCLMVLEQ